MLGVPTVGLDPIARRPRNLRRRRDHTLHAALGEVPSEPVPRRAGLIRGAHRAGQTRAERGRGNALAAHPEALQLSRLAVKDRRHDLRGMHIQADEGSSLRHGWFLLCGCGRRAGCHPHGYKSPRARREGPANIYSPGRTTTSIWSYVAEAPGDAEAWRVTHEDRWNGVATGTEPAGMDARRPGGRGDGRARHPCLADAACRATSDGRRAQRDPQNSSVTATTPLGRRPAMKVLVLTSEPITADQLRGALRTDVDPSDAEVMVVAPAYAESGLKFWMSDADDAIAKAEQVRRDSVQELDKAGVPATGDTGESDPHTAIEDALKTFEADRIVVFTHTREDQRHREDLDRDELAERFGIPVDQAVV